MYQNICSIETYFQAFIKLKFNPKIVLSFWWSHFCNICFCTGMHNDIFFPLGFMWCVAQFVPFVQFKKLKEHPWRSFTLRKVTFLHECFSSYLNCTNGTKSCKTSHVLKSDAFTTFSFFLCKNKNEDSKNYKLIYASKFWHLNRNG